jgi:hypothetical protein
MSTSRCILLDHTTLEINKSPVLRRFDSLSTIRLWARHVTYPRSCPHWRSTHPFLRRFDLLRTSRLWARYVAYSSIMPTLEINTSLPSSIRFTWYYKIMSTWRCILFDHAHIRDQHIPSFVDSIRLVLQDYEQVMLHTPQSCPHWRSTHPFLCWFNSPITTRLWACHVAYSSIMPTLDNNTSLPSSIWFA